MEEYKIFGDSFDKYTGEAEEFTVPNGVKTISWLAFRGCKFLKSVILPPSVRTIRTGAFYGCRSLERVVLPKKLERIEENAFADCKSLKEIDVPSSTEISLSAFQGCISLKDEDGFIFAGTILVAYIGKAAQVAVPSKTTAIGNSAFEKCKTLQAVSIPGSVKQIGNEAFKGCESLERVDLSEGLEIIDYSAFKNCTSIKEIIVPSSVRIVWVEAFAGCTSLERVVGIKDIGDRIFANCAALKSVTIPESITYGARSAFEGCGKLDFIMAGKTLISYSNIPTEIVIPSTVEAIGESAFADNKELKAVVIPPSVKKIMPGAFRGCISLERVVLPEGLEEMGNNVFGSCKSLKEITIPTTVKRIGAYEFSDCISLKRVILPEGPEEIVYDAFLGCSSLREIVLPASVKKIGVNTFKGCPLETLILRGSAPKGLKALPGLVIEAPNASLSDFLVCRDEYLVGFLRLLKRGEAPGEIVAKNNKCIRQNAQKFCETKDPELLAYMFRNRLIPLKDVDELIRKFSERKDTERVAALIEYREAQFTEEEKDKLFQKQFELKEPTEFERLRNMWRFSRTAEGTYRISGYKGEDEDVVVPATLRGIQVSEIGNGSEHFFSDELRDRVKSIILPEGIKTIRTMAFNGCGALKSIVLPKGLKTLECDAFWGSGSLKKVVLSEGLETIGCDAFWDCSALEEVVLPEGLKEIGPGAFGRCSSLKTIIIPVTVEKIGVRIFVNCPGITVYCRGEKEPDGWAEGWDNADSGWWGDKKAKVNVVWGYKGE